MSTMAMPMASVPFGCMPAYHPNLMLPMGTLAPQMLWNPAWQSAFCTPAPAVAEQVGRPLLPPRALAVMPIHLRASSQGGQPLCRILCYGDSLTVGYCSNGQLFEPYGRAMSEALAAAGFACEVSICGHSGKTTHEMVAALGGRLVDIVGCQGQGLEQILAEQEYDLVIIMSGTNDMGMGASQDAILTDLSRLHSACHDRGVPTVALAPPPAPIGGPQREVARRCLADRIRALAASSPGMLACIDPADLVPMGLAFWERDGLHFSPAGSCLLGERLAAVAAEKLLECAAYAPDVQGRHARTTSDESTSKKRQASRCASEVAWLVRDPRHLHAAVA
ncbi:unnamed protein product [Polarella glacialis]|uniref:SGNH hydrolase-type esterase domain-containing protein n=1 Tax=Polarella glacialis TaxID=89957 RepID=A0A813L9C8_POLGL|nr:unnamed protein product [Polarella glacialis]